MNIDELLLRSYLAGAMDADGWFTICRKPPGRGARPRVTDGFHIQVGLSQTDPAIPSLLRARYGGTFRSVQRKPHNRGSNGYRRIYTWGAHRASSLALIDDLLPYLRIKKRQAELCLELQRDIDKRLGSWCQPGQKGRRPLTAEVLAFRRTLYEEMRNLHDSRATPLALL